MLYKRIRWTAAALATAVLAIEHYLVKYAIGRNGGGGNRKVALDVGERKTEARTSSKNEAVRTGADKSVPCRAEYGKTDTLLSFNHEKQKRLTEDFKERVTEQKVCVISKDHLKLSGAFFEQTGSHLWAILIHGYRSSHHSMIHYAQRYYDAGYQVLTPDLRACGESEGKFLGMGWPDREDMREWISWILQKDSQAKIVLHGVSMGAATVMMTSGEDTPDAVRAFVEDCGYTGVWDMFASELKLRFHLPQFPLLPIASGMNKIRVGYSFREASSLEQIKGCHKPMLFIHGDKDDFVPFEMLDILYENKPGMNKQKIPVRGAGHGEAYKVLGDRYWEMVFGFLAPYLR